MGKNVPNLAISGVNHFLETSQPPADEADAISMTIYLLSHGFQTKSSGEDAWQQGHHADAEAKNSTALGNASHARGKNSVAIGYGSVAVEDDALSVGNADIKRGITHVAGGKANSDAINLGQFKRVLTTTRQKAVQQANSYTDQKVGELRNKVQNLDKTFSKGIASSAVLQRVTPYAPGRVAINAGTAVYRGQAAVAAGVSWWHPSGNINVNGGVSSAGTNSTIVRAGAGYLF